MRIKGTSVDRILLNVAKQVTLVIGVKPSWRYRVRVWIAAALFAAGSWMAGFNTRLDVSGDEETPCST